MGGFCDASGNCSGINAWGGITPPAGCDNCSVPVGAYGAGPGGVPYNWGPGYLSSASSGANGLLSSQVPYLSSVAQAIGLPSMPGYTYIWNETWTQNSNFEGTLNDTLIGFFRNGGNQIGDETYISSQNNNTPFTSATDQEKLKALQSVSNVAPSWFYTKQFSDRVCNFLKSVGLASLLVGVSNPETAPVTGPAGSVSGIGALVGCSW